MTSAVVAADADAAAAWAAREVGLASAGACASTVADLPACAVAHRCASAAGCADAGDGAAGGAAADGDGGDVGRDTC